MVGPRHNIFQCPVSQLTGSRWLLSFPWAFASHATNIDILIPFYWISGFWQCTISTVKEPTHQHTSAQPSRAKTLAVFSNSSTVVTSVNIRDPYQTKLIGRDIVYPEELPIPWLPAIFVRAAYHPHVSAPQFLNNNSWHYLICSVNIVDGIFLIIPPPVQNWGTRAAFSVGSLNASVCFESSLIVSAIDVYYTVTTLLPSAWFEGAYMVFHLFSI